jgi:hypothetical protein
MSAEFKIPNPVDFPLASLRQFLLPDQVMRLKVFQAASVAELEVQIKDWLNESKSIIAVPGPISVVNYVYFLALTYVPSSEGTENG